MDKVDEEAKFVKAVDKILPLLMIELGEKKAYWSRHDITLDALKENKKTMFVSAHVSPYYDMIFDWLDKRGNISNS